MRARRVGCRWLDSNFHQAQRWWYARVLASPSQRHTSCLSIPPPTSGFIRTRQSKHKKGGDMPPTNVTGQSMERRERLFLQSRIGTLFCLREPQRYSSMWTRWALNPFSSFKFIFPCFQYSNNNRCIIEKECERMERDEPQSRQWPSFETTALFKPTFDTSDDDET